MSAFCPEACPDADACVVGHPCAQNSAKPNVPPSYQKYKNPEQAARLARRNMYYYNKSKAGRARQRARGRAWRALAKRYPDEFRQLYDQFVKEELEK